MPIFNEFYFSWNLYFICIMPIHDIIWHTSFAIYRSQIWICPLTALDDDGLVLFPKSSHFWCFDRIWLLEKLCYFWFSFIDFSWNCRLSWFKFLFGTCHKNIIGDAFSDRISYFHIMQISSWKFNVLAYSGRIIY